MVISGDPKNSFTFSQDSHYYVVINCPFRKTNFRAEVGTCTQIRNRRSRNNENNGVGKMDRYVQTK